MKLFLARGIEDDHYWVVRQTEREPETTELTSNQSSLQPPDQAPPRNWTRDASIFVKSLLGWDSLRGSGRAVW